MSGPAVFHVIIIIIIIRFVKRQNIKRLPWRYEMATYFSSSVFVPRNFRCVDRGRVRSLLVYEIYLQLSITLYSVMCLHSNDNVGVDDCMILD